MSDDQHASDTGLAPGQRSILDDELGMAARVARRIARSIAEQSEQRAPQKRVRHDQELMALRDQIGEARNEDVAALLAAMIHTAGVARVDVPRAAGMVDPQTPYFGHMRLEEGGRKRDFLIGKRGMIDREAGVVIVDWRDAPVSRLYYRYDEGDEYEEELGDKVREGSVLVRRTVTFTDGNLTRVRCPDGTFVRGKDDQWRALETRETPELKGGVGKAERAPPEGRAGPAGARRAGRLGLGDAHLRPDKHLPEIAALIDAKQFDAMTQPTSGLVILQGGAGSGKTTVALHRVAWLAFEAPAQFRPQRMIVVVAQPQLARYVERLLPALDCQGVRVFAYEDWVRRAVERVLGSEGRDTGRSARRGAGRGAGRKRDRVLGRRVVADVPSEVSRVKKHPAMLAAVQEQWQSRFTALMGSIEQILTTDVDAELRRAWTEQPEDRTVARVRRFAGKVDKSGADASTKIRLQKVLEAFLAQADDMLADWEDLVTDSRLLARTGVDAHTLELVLRHTRRQIEEPADFSDVAPEHKTPVDDHGEDPDDPLQAFDVHDLPLLLNMWIARHGQLASHERAADLQYDLVVVDEAQDLAAVELAPLIVATGERRSVTLAGDVVQKLIFDTGYDDWMELEAQLAPYMLGRSALNVEPFKLSYRSTAEVVAFAREVLGPLAPAEAPRAVRSGAPVEVFSFSDPGEEMAFLAENLRSLMGREPQASVAVLCRYPERARFYADMLSRAEVPRIRLVLGQRDAHGDAHDDFSFTPGVDVTHVSRVKGLEYDYVILAEVTEAMYPDQVASRHLLHIGATRAAHQLWITTSTQSPSPLLPPHLLAASEV